ncbi:LRR receptor-like serine threonine-protein kinase [Seminavis robusta]|uniref:LRR receptor-like serine threonine-protein kinase n=1 Tax=Seminavis robusta TaxID=568900 RepID=A0A9N8H275_9STRA|nr:LRR receptor-like serine threonine-protein kinase [Seminavis robusta]|eukprot:Sro5_g003950.1 LRR receptor-like serine threonine-protein kinase (205) ;mRNA; r:13173-13787
MEGDSQLELSMLGGNLPSELGLLYNPSNFDEHPLTMLSFTTAPDNNLSGELPPQIGLSRNLYGLLLHNNAFSGTLPEETWDLRSMLYMALSGNQFSGTIDTKIGQLSSMAMLSLQNNNFAGPLPSEPGHLTQMARLNAAGNRLSGKIHVEIGGLANGSSLVSFNVSNNLLSGRIPSDLCWLDAFGSLGFDCTSLLCGCSCSCNQ